MPRKKTVQPEPDQIIWIDQECYAEVRGPGSYEIFRGSHKVNELEDRRCRALNSVIDLYVTPSGVISNTDKGPLRSAAEFDAYLVRNNVLPEITDGQAVRKRIYKWVKEQTEIFIKCKQSPTP